MSDFLPMTVVRRTPGSLRTLVVAGALLSAACHKKPPRVYIPPAVQHPAPVPLKVPADLNPPELAPEALTGLELSEIGPGIPEIQPPPAPPAPARPRPPVATAPKPVTPPPTAPEPQAPKIVQIFPKEQQNAFNRELDDILNRDQQTLETVARRNLSSDMRDRMAQIRELLAQAKQAREQDLATAVALARRADTLAKDLQSRLP